MDYNNFKDSTIKEDYGTFKATYNSTNSDAIDIYSPNNAFLMYVSNMKLVDGVLTFTMPKQTLANGDVIEGNKTVVSGSAMFDGTFADRYIEVKGRWFESNGLTQKGYFRLFIRKQLWFLNYKFILGTGKPIFGNG